MNFSRLSAPATRLSTVAALALLTASADAQIFDLGGATNDRGFHQPSARRNMTRLGRMLYSAVVQQDGTVQIRFKVDDLTMTPWSTFVAAVNDTATGIGTVNPTTTVAMAGTGDNCLHVTWGRYYYPSFFRQYYRCFRINTSSFTHPPQDITALVGASSTTRTDSMAIAVGANNQVYVTAQDGPSSWRSRLLQSDWSGFPTGAAPAWLNRGSISASASSTNVRMVVDVAGRVQMAFYNNVGNGQYATRVFTPPATWGTQEQIGVPPAPRDDVGYMATDFSRFTHVLYKHLVSQVGSLITYELRYRRRMDTLPWSAPIVVDTFTSVDHGTDNPRDGFALAATQKGDRVFAIYRDYDCKRLMVKQKKFTDPSFEFLSVLRPASGVQNDYYMPSVRNTLWPTDNGLITHLDISYREPTGSTFELTHQRLQVGKMNVDLTGCAGTCGVPAITYAGVPCSPSAPRSITIGVEQARPGATAFLVYSLSSMTIPFAGCSLYGLSVMSVQTVSPCCTAEATFALPAGCGTTTIYNQWGILDTAATGGWAMSNRGKIQL